VAFIFPKFHRKHVAAKSTSVRSLFAALFPDPTEIPERRSAPASFSLRRESVNFAAWLKACPRLSIIGEWAGKAALASRSAAN
jgi:hypothetical protein